MEIDESLSITLQQFSNQLDTLSNKVDAFLNQKERLIELSWWDLHNMDVYAGLFILVFGWLAYRSFFKK